MGYSKQSRRSTAQTNHTTIWIAFIGIVAICGLLGAFLALKPNSTLESNEDGYTPKATISNSGSTTKAVFAAAEDTSSESVLGQEVSVNDEPTIREERIDSDETSTDIEPKPTKSKFAKSARRSKSANKTISSATPRFYSNLNNLSSGQRKIPNDIDKSPLKLSSKEMDNFKSAGRWNGDDIEDLKYAGFSFGSSAFCEYGKEHCWSVQYMSAPNEEGACRVYNDQHVTRFTLDDNVTKYDKAEAYYTCKSEQLDHLFFSKDLGETQADLEMANDIIASNFQILVNELGIPEESFRVEEFSDGRIYFDIHTDTYDIYSSSTKNHDGTYQAQMTITNRELEKLAQKEFEEDCANSAKWQEQKH